MTSNQWEIWMWFFAVAGVTSALFLPFFVSLLLLIPMMGSGMAMVGTTNRPKAIEPAKIDGRTHQEWYDLILPMGREEFERLSRPALDGLEDSTEGYGGWNVERLLGPSLHLKLRKEFYPEKFCSVHFNDECSDPQECKQMMTLSKELHRQRKGYSEWCQACYEPCCPGCYRLDRKMNGYYTTREIRVDYLEQPVRVVKVPPAKVVRNDDDYLRALNEAVKYSEAELHRALRLEKQGRADYMVRKGLT